MDDYKNLEDQICEEIREWSRFALEKPNKNYNNLPSCPFAKTAWKDKKVSFAFKNTNSYYCLDTLIDCFKDNKDLIIIVDMCFVNNEKFHKHLSDTMKKFNKANINKKIFG